MNEDVNKIQKDLELELRYSKINDKKALSAKNVNYFIRTFGVNKAGYFFQLTRYSIFGILTLYLLLSICMLGQEVYHAFYDQKETPSISFVSMYNESLKSSGVDTLTQAQLIHLYNLLPDENIYSKNQKEIESLKIIEHIFIYMLPFLVLLNLYYYFEANFKNKLIARTEPNEIDVSLAEKSLNTTKTLFISSMLAFSIIKTIEVIYLSKKEIDFKHIIAYSSFLLLLMGYLLLSHTKDKSKSPEGLKLK